MLEKPSQNKIIFIKSNLNSKIICTEKNSTEDQEIPEKNSSRFIIGENYKISILDNTIKKWQRLNNYSVVVEDEFRQLFTRNKKNFLLFLLMCPIFPYIIFQIFTTLTNNFETILSPIFFLILIVFSIYLNCKVLMLCAGQKDKRIIANLNRFEKIYVAIFLGVSLVISCVALYLIGSVILLVGFLKSSIIVKITIFFSEKILLIQIIPFVILMALEFYYYDKSLIIYNKINSKMDDFMK